MPEWVEWFLSYLFYWELANLNINQSEIISMSKLTKSVKYLLITATNFYSPIHTLK